MPYDIGRGATGALSGAASGAALGSVVPGIGTAFGAIGGGLLGLFGGMKDKDPRIKNIQRLTPEQQQNLLQLQNAIKGEGAGGAFGDVADYFRGNLSNNPQDFDAFAAPEIRRYNEQIIPDLANQFSGLGYGGSGLSGSGFRNAAVNSGTELSEKLGAIRANLRNQSAQSLMNLGQLGLGNYSENVRNEPQPSFGNYVAEGVGSGVGNAIPSVLSDYLKKQQQQPSVANTGIRQTSPYGGTGTGAYGLPNFNAGR